MVDNDGAARLVAYRWWRKNRTRCDLEDCLSEARIGYLIAARKFDPARGYKFITYANWWANQRVREYVRRACLRGMVYASESQEFVVAPFAHRDPEWDRETEDPEYLGDVRDVWEEVAANMSVSNYVALELHFFQGESAWAAAIKCGLSWPRMKFLLRTMKRRLADRLRVPGED